MSFVYALLLSAGIAQAEPLVKPAPRQGYFLALGGAGLVSRTQDDHLAQRRTLGGGAVSLRAGEMLTDRLGFGVRVETGSAQDDRWDATLAGFGVDMQVVPWRHLALHGGAGVGSWQARDGDGVYEKARGTGGAYYGLGVSYDVFLTSGRASGWLAITPGLYARYLPGDEYRTISLWAGVELSYWSGLDKKELELPLDEAFRRE